MSYPSQPGYPTSPYGQPQSPQQNNLWMIGGAIVVVLVIIMTVILLVVQQTAGDDAAGSDGSTTGEPDPSDDGGGDTTGSEGGDEGNDGGGATEMTAEACDLYDMSQFESAYGTYVPEETYRSATTSNGLSSLNCTFYNPDATSVNVYVTDYEDAAYVKEWVESDVDYYTEADGYEFSEYTEMGDAGSMYSLADADLGYKSIYIHVALGSLDVKVNTSLYDSESVDEAAAIATLEDFLAQSDGLFADYQ